MANIDKPILERMLDAKEINRKQYDAFVSICSEETRDKFVTPGLVNTNTFNALCSCGLFEEKQTPYLRGYALSERGREIWDDFSEYLSTE